MPSGPVRGNLGRRAFLFGAAAFLAGCGRARPAGGAASTVLWSRPAERDLYARVPGLAAAFNASHRGLSVAAGSTPEAGTRSPFTLALAPAPAEGSGRGLVPLGAALRQDGFVSARVAPQALDLYRVEGALLGLPVAQWPIAVRWRADAFAAAGLSAPAPQWTVADFEAACLAIAGVIRTGAVPGLQAVLFPMGDRPGAVPGALGQPGWWSAFALGYGGSVVQGGRFSFDSNAVLGLGALAGLARRFGAPAAAAADVAALPGRCAMALDYWGPPGGGGLAPSLEATVPGLRFGAGW
jgi:ABC-type glycerol-3-phosphate transport system substrate-binding protein